MGFSSNPGAVQMPTQAQAPSMAQPTGPNVFQQSASALSQAQNAAGGLANFQANPMQAAQLGPAAQLSNLNVGSYMNPYINQVVNRGQKDIERQRQMASNALGAEATAAGAFGGSRQAVQEGVLAGEAARAAGDLSAQQRQAGFNQALQAGQFDAAAMNQFALQQGNLQQQANQANYGGQFNAANVRQGASGLLGNLAQTGYGFGTGLAGQQAQQGAAMQGMNQSLIDAARNQYGGFTGAPMDSLNAMLASVGAGNMGQRTETTSRQPGVLDWLQLITNATATAAGASDRRLKTNVQLLGQHNGINIYSWDWNEEGEKIANPDQPTLGVMADELMQTHPHLVHRAADGYLRVNYNGLG